MRIDLPAAVRVHATTRHGVHVVVVRGHEGRLGVGQARTGADAQGLVEVNAQVIHRVVADDGEIGLVDHGHEAVLLDELDELGIVSAVHARVQEALVGEELGDVGGASVGGIFGTRIGGREVEHDADLGVGQDLMAGTDSQRAGERRVVGNLCRGLRVDPAGIVVLLQIAALHVHDGLVERVPALDDVAEQLERNAGIAFVEVDDLAAFPAAALLQGDGHVEVEQVHEGLDVLVAQRAEHVAVELDGLGVGVALRIGQQARPADRGAEGVLPRLVQQLDILAPMLEERRRVGWTDAAVELVGLLLEPEVPDIRGLVIGGMGALRLGRARGTTEVEPFRELDVHRLTSFSSRTGRCRSR